MRPCFHRPLMQRRRLRCCLRCSRMLTNRLPRILGFAALVAMLTAAWPCRPVVAQQPTAYQNPTREPAVGQLISSGHSVGAASDSSQVPTARPASPPASWTTPSSTAARPSPVESLPPSPNFIQAPSNSAVVHASASQETDGLKKPPQVQPRAKERVPLRQEGGSTESGATPGGSGGTVQMLLSIGSSLLIVVGLFLGLAWFYKKTMTSSLTGGLPKQVVQVLGRTHIATRQQLVLVRFGSKLVLVSLVQGEARTISEINDPLEVDQLAGICESSQPGSISNSFRSILNQGGSV